MRRRGLLQAFGLAIPALAAGGVLMPVKAIKYKRPGRRSPIEGDIWFDNSNELVYVWKGYWQPFGLTVSAGPDLSITAHFVTPPEANRLFICSAPPRVDDIFQKIPDTGSLVRVVTVTPNASPAMI